MTGRTAINELTNAAVMHVDFERLSPFCTLREALQQLTRPFRPYASIEASGRFLGLVFEQDVRRALAARPTRSRGQDDNSMLDKTSIMSVCWRQPYAAHPAGSAIASAQFMLHKQIGCLPVIEHETGTAMGLVTLNELTRTLEALNTARLSEARPSIPFASIGAPTFLH